MGKIQKPWHDIKGNFSYLELDRNVANSAILICTGSISLKIFYENIHIIQVMRTCSEH